MCFVFFIFHSPSHFPPPPPDPCETPLLELSMSCDNLLCDALGRAPSARVVIHARNNTGPASSHHWRRIAQTEVVEVRTEAQTCTLSGA